jgi:hypothetical protein
MNNLFSKGEKYKKGRRMTAYEVRYSIRLWGMSLCLCSTATLYTTMHVQLWFQRTTHPSPKTLGQLTSAPFLPSMPSKKRYDRPRVFYPCMAFLQGTQATQLERCSVGELSLSTLVAECLSLQADCSATVQTMQEAPSADALLACRAQALRVFPRGTGVRRVRT